MKGLYRKNIVITGATSGIGRAAAVRLAGSGARLIAAGRSPEECGNLREELAGKFPEAEIYTLSADLSSRETVADLSRQITETIEGFDRPVLDVLINNAAQVTSWYRPTADGYETQFAVNHLAPFQLTVKLLPLLEKSDGARIITVSSASHRRTVMKWDDIMFRQGYGTLKAYKQSKLANVIFTAELNRRLSGKKNIQAFAADPGLVNTEIGLKHTSGLVYFFWKARKNRGCSPEEAAGNIVFLAMDESPDISSGIYWKNRKPVKPSPMALDPETGEKLWRLSERLSGTDSSAGF